MTYIYHVTRLLQGEKQRGVNYFTEARLSARLLVQTAQLRLCHQPE
jgi:hypothetical protein